jgi:hypothetical protein
MAYLINDPLSMATDGTFSLAQQGGGDTVAATVSGTITTTSMAGSVAMGTVAGAIIPVSITGTVTLEPISTTITPPTFTGETE